MHLNGQFGFIKELYHEGTWNSGYAYERGMVKATNQSMMNRWVGFKVVIYNINNNKGVKMESYFDEQANNQWKKVVDTVDDAAHPWSVGVLSEYYDYGNNCTNRDTGTSPLKPDEIITWAGQWVSFRSDYSIYDFKNLTVREIQPPVP